MMKFFRKYNKQLLAVFMVLLMIVFIGGTALESLVAPTFDPVVATSRFGKITGADQQAASATTQVLSMLGLNWRRMDGNAGGEPLTETDWVLLNREAKYLGTTAPLSSARSWLGFSPEVVDQFSIRVGVKHDSIVRAVQEFQSVDRTGRVMASVSVPSASEVLVAARDSLEKVRIKAITLSAGAFLNEDESFSEEELKAQFEEYRSSEPGEGLEFGYYLPPALKVQYIRIDRERIAEGVRVPNLMHLAENYYHENLTDPAFAAKHEEALADPEHPEDCEPPDPYMPWWEAQDIAAEIVKEQRAEEIASRLSDWLINYAQEAFIVVSQGEDGYKIAPPEVANLAYYQQLVERIPPKLAYKGSVEVRETPFFSTQEALNVPDIGKAYRKGQLWEGSLQDLPFQTKAIVPRVPRAEGVRFEEFLSTYQTSLQPLVDSDGNLFVWRVVDAKPGREPESLADVRERVVADLQLQRAYERAKATAERLVAAVAGSDLKALYESDSDLQALRQSAGSDRIGYVEPEPFARVAGMFQAAQGRDPNGVVVAGVGRLPNEVVDACFALEKEPDHAAAIPLVSSATGAVAQWAETIPARQDEFDRLRPFLTTQIASIKQREAMRAWYDPERIRARAGYEEVLRR